MFFNKRKNAAAFISNKMLDTFRLGFATSSYLDTSTGQIAYPYGFMADEYVVGYSTGFTFAWLDIKFEGHKMSYAQREEVLHRVFHALAPNDTRRMLEIAGTVNSKSAATHAQFFEGYDAASLFVGLMNGVRLRADYTNPKLEAAKKIAPTLRQAGIALGGAASGSKDSETLASALLQVTLREHIREQY
ncbi:hypothetical protein [Shimia aestuarii]|uniref:hypothetical protein n=1 Tax=Shimia aestuarii TaxID=254406 RepID=UPI001FB3D4C3|nr:hypothetical protein [Shimia aestuarii]